MSQDKKINVSVDDSGVSKLRQSANELAKDMIRSSRAYSTSSKEVLKDLEDLNTPFFYMDKEGLREDLNFCLEAKKKGHRIFVDTTVQIGHLGERQIVDHYYINSQVEHLEK